MDSLFGGSSGGGSYVDPTQQPFLKDLYERGQQVSYGTGGQDFGRQFEQPTFGVFNQLAGGGSMIPGLQQVLQNFGGQQDEALGGAIDAGLNDITRNFTQNIMPGINTGAAMAGTSGGSRQGIAQGVAAGEANRNASDFVNRMRSGNWQNQMTNQLGAYTGLTNIQGQRNQAMGGALTQAPNVANLGFENQYGNIQNYSKTIGAPNVLGRETNRTNGVIAPLQFGYTGGG